MKGVRQMPVVVVRMPPDLKVRIQDIAKKSLRSMNSEIVRMLSAQLEKENAPSAGTGEALVTQ